MGSVAAIALAVIFAWSAAAKIGSQKRTATGFADLGLPFAGVLARAVPAAEIVTAGLLVLSPGWGGVLAFGLLAAFTVLLITTISSGRLVPCRCFGGTSDAPVSWWDVARNCWLGMLAIAATTIQQLSVPGPAGGVAGFALVVIGGVGVFRGKRLQR